MDIQQWVAACPDQFPEYLDGTTSNHNPVIGETQMDTLHSITNILGLIQELFLFPHAQDNGVDFDEQVTEGIGCILSCAIDALQFEIKHRSDGGTQVKD